MKKNLRIVSVAVSTVSADATTGSNYTEINLGSTTNVAENPDVDVTPSLTLIGKNGNIPGSLTGTISASFGGNTYTANLSSANGNKDVTIFDGAKGVKAADVVSGSTYNIAIRNVGFNFGTANANKKVTITSSNSKVTFVAGKNNKNIQVSNGGKTATATTDVNGTVSGLTLHYFGVTAFDPTYTNDVVFYDTTTGEKATTGTATVYAGSNGQLNTSDVSKAVMGGKFVAVQPTTSNPFNTLQLDTTADDIASQLKAEGISVDANNNFTAPHTFTVTLKATSSLNGKSATLPVTVTVANVPEATEPSVSKTVMHAAYYYDKNGSRVGTDVVPTYSSVNLVSDSSASNGLKTYTINGNSYYKIANEDKYIAAGNVTGTSRTLKHNAYVYKTSKKRANKVTLKKGSSVTTYGSPVKLANGKLYYRIGQTQYVKKANF